MKLFRANDGYLHFLFANEDDYYLDSLVRLDLRQYLYYCLKREGYRGVYFLDGTKNDVQICMLDRSSVDEFPRDTTRGILWLQAQLPVDTVTENGRTVYEIRLEGEQDWFRRLENMLKKKQDAYAFVVPMGLFFRLFREQEHAQALWERLENDRQKSIFVVTAPLSADASMDYLLAKDGPFCSRLCPEVLRVNNRAKKVLLYEEMERELKNRYQVFNQLDKNDILRMLRYGSLIQGRDWPVYEKDLQDTADLIYFWYHSPQFAAGQPGLLPENENRQLSVIAGALDLKENRKEIEKSIKRFRRERPEDMSLSRILALDYPVMERFHPRREPSSILRRLQRFSISGLTGEEGTAFCRQLSGRFTKIQEDMQRVYSGAGLQKEDEWVEFCLDELQSLDENGYQDADAVERIVDFLDYLVVKDEKARQPELFLEKVEYYRQIVKLSVKIVFEKHRVNEYEERIRENRLKIYEKMGEILRWEKEAPHLAKETEAVLQSRGGRSYSGEYLSLTAEKEAVVCLDEDCKNLRRLSAENKSQINLYRKAIQQFDLSIAELSGGNLTDLSEIMRNAVNSAQRKRIAEEKLGKELKEAADECQDIHEKMPAAERILSGYDIDEKFVRIAESLAADKEEEEGLHA